MRGPGGGDGKKILTLKPMARHRREWNMSEKKKIRAVIFDMDGCRRKSF